MKRISFFVRVSNWVQKLKKKKVFKIQKYIGRSAI